MVPTFGGAAALKQSTGKLGLGLPGMQLQNSLGKNSVSKQGPSITTQIIIEGTSSDDDDSDRDEEIVKDKVVRT